MRKNRSFKENSFARSKGSKGKEISIEIDRSKPAASNRYDLEGSSRNTTDRLNASSNWQHNPSISHNILKEIINYSNISQTSNRASRGATIAVFDKSNDNVLTQLAKIKKTSLGEAIPRKDAKRLTLDFAERQNKTIDIVEMTKSVALPSKEEMQRRTESEALSGCTSIEIFQMTPEERMKLEIQKSQIATSLQQLTILEQSIQNEHSEMIPHWQKMIVCEEMISKLESEIQRLEKVLAGHRNRLEELNFSLFSFSKELISSRRQWDAKGNGARGQLIEEAESTHEEFLRRLTIKDFEQTVLFNMRVAIPDYKGKTNVRGIYEELFRSRSAKKFTMILKKHTAHMDLYDGRLLSDFTKRINDLQTLFFKAEAQTKHPDQNFLEPIAQIVTEIDQLRTSIYKQEMLLKQQKIQLQLYRDENRQCEQNIHNLIEELNSQVSGQYERETQRQADFKALLLAKIISIYRQFRSIKQKKQKMSEEVMRLQQKLGLLPYENS